MAVDAGKNTAGIPHKIITIRIIPHIGRLQIIMIKSRVRARRGAGQIVPNFRPRDQQMAAAIQITRQQRPFPAVERGIRRGILTHEPIERHVIPQPHHLIYHRLIHRPIKRHTATCQRPRMFYRVIVPIHALQEHALRIAQRGAVILRDHRALVQAVEAIHD